MDTPSTLLGRRVDPRAETTPLPAALPASPGPLPASLTAPLAPLPPAGSSPDPARYALEEEVGRGGMGRVMRARDQVLLREVALKVVAGASPEAEERFQAEARITGQLDHPNVLPVYDLGQDREGRPFFTMKLVRGHESLADVIDRLRAEDPATQRRFSFERRVQVIQAVCHALHYAHERGVVHRDLKPQNVVLGPWGEVYLVDWGVARVLQAGAKAPVEAPVEAPLEAPVQAGPLASASGPEVIGTPAYMAPEQLLEGQADVVSDVYALCAVLYELLTLNWYLGHVEEGLAPLALAKRDRVPLPAESFQDPVYGRVPRALSRVLERGLSKAREQRFQSAQELEDALQRWFEGTTPIVCAGTCMQRVLSRWSYLIDQRPFVVPVLSLLLFALLLSSVVNTITRSVRVLLW